MANESSVLVRLRLLGGQAFAGGARAAGRGLDSLGGSGNVAQKALRGVSSVMGLVTAAVKGVTLAVGVGAVALGSYGVKKAANFEQAMANVQARLLTSKQNMEALSGQALKLGADTSFSAQQAADAMGEFAAAGFNAREIMKIMPGTLDLAAASSTDLASAAETAGAITRQFGLHASDMGHVADVLTLAVNKSAIGMDDLALSMKYVGPVAGRFKQSLEDMGASVAILGNVGIKGETAGTTLRRALVNIVKPSGRTIDMLDGMGITMKDFNRATIDAHGDLRPMPAILGNLAKQFAGLSKPDRRRAITQLFGVEALPGMLTLFGKGEKGINKMSNALTHSEGAAKRTAKIMRGTVKGAWDQFTGGVETAAISLTTRFNPAIRKGLLGASKLVGKAGKIASGFIGAVSGDTQTQGAGSVGQVAPRELTGAQKAGMKVRQVLGNVVAWATSNLPKLGRSVMGVVRQIMSAFAPAIPFVTNIILPLFKGIAIGVIGGVVAAFKVVIPIIRVVATVLGWLGTKAAPLKGFIQGIGVAIGFIAGGPILKALGALGKLGIVFRIMAVPIRIVGGLFGWAFRGVVKLAGAFIRTHLAVLRFVATFASAPARVLRGALNIVGTIISTLGRLYGKIISLGLRLGASLIGRLISGVRSRLGQLAGFFGRVGSSIVSAITSAIASAPGAIMSALLNIVPDKLKGAVRRLFPGAATGGVISRGGLAVVGERGPELAEFPTGTTVYDAGQTRRARASMAPPRQEVFVAELHLDGKKVHEVVFKRDRQITEAR